MVANRQPVRIPDPVVRETDAEGNPVEEGAAAAPVPTKTSGKPKWCKPFPPGFVVPKGKRPVFMRFRPGWTDRPDKGERQCVCWGISVGEEVIADKHGEESYQKALRERAKISIRLIDGGPGSPTLVPVDWSKSRADEDPDIFWEEIGLKCRSLITNAFLQASSLSAEERSDFFENCIEVVDAV